MSNIDMSLLISEEETQSLASQQKQMQTNAEARAYLESTDWYVLREAETGVAVPNEIRTKRASCRDAIVS